MKNAKIKGVKVKIFDERELREKIRSTENEIGLIMSYQKKFPELIQEHKEEDFLIDGENLCNELEVKSDYTDWLLANRSKVQGKLIKYRMIENKDYIVKLAPRNPEANKHGGNNKKQILLTINCAKKIAMRQNNEMGDLVCDYFILAEKTLRNYETWTNIREPQKENNKILMASLDKKSQENNNFKKTNPSVYWTENDMLNLSLVGYRAKQVKTLLDYKDKITREHFSCDINKALAELQLIDDSLVISNITYQQRKEIIKSTCKNKYSHLKVEFQEFVESINKKVI